MKTVLTICVLTFFVKLHAQKLHVDKKTSLITIDTVIQFTNIQDEDIYNNVQNWFVEYFNDAKDVIRGQIEPKMIKGTYAAAYPEGGVLGGYKQFYNDIMVRINGGVVTITINNIRCHDLNYPKLMDWAIEGHYSKKDGTMRQAGMYQDFINVANKKSTGLFGSMSKYITTSSL